MNSEKTKILINDIIDKWIKETISLMKKAILSKSKGPIDFVDKIEFRIDGTNVYFEYPEYGKWIDSGRGPGKMPPFSSLTGWMKKHNIENKWAFPIAKNIGQVGIKSRPFIHIFEDRFPILEDKIEQALYDEFI
jgi:hypothetical protein